MSVSKRWQVPVGYRVRRCASCTVGPIAATKQGEPYDIKILDSEEVPPGSYMIPCPVCGKFNVLKSNSKEAV